MTKSLTEIATEVAARPDVSRAKVWEGRRVYVNIVGYDPARAGDRNAKVFYDARLGWVIDGIKGCMSSEFRANLRKFATDYIPGMVGRF